MSFVLVGLGGFLGANARYLLSDVIAQRLGTGFPSHTLVVNLSGSFLVGVVLSLLSERLVADPGWRLFLVVGFLGGYTTFSSYTFEALALSEQGLWVRALLYVLASNGLGLLATFLGILAVRALWR